MKVEAVERKHHTCLFPMAKGALMGAALGFVTKYAYPLNSEEKGAQAYKGAIEEINTQKKQYSSDTREFLSDIEKKTFKSPAEDTFIKMYDGMKEGDSLSFRRRRNALKTIKENSPDFVDDFKLLYRRARDLAEINAKKCIEAYSFATKHMRPTAVFVAGGAVVGALIALIKDVLRTDVQHH